VNPDSPTRYGTVIQMKNLLFNMMVFHSWPRSYGADWMDADGNITVDSEAYREALEMAKMLYDAGATPADSTSYEYAEANAAFSSGQVAAMVQWNAAAGELTTAQPATATFAPPAGPEGRFTHIHGLGLGMNAAAENKEGAQAFLSGCRPRKPRSPMPAPVAHRALPATRSRNSPPSGPTWCRWASTPRPMAS
jgi:multiple sugar transport system substrate-binding protein